MTPSVNEYTLYSIPLRMSRGKASCYGTGFLYLHNSTHYLVTAWHNVSGRNFLDKQPISQALWLPLHMHVKLPIEYKTVSETETEVGTFDLRHEVIF